MTELITTFSMQENMKLIQKSQELLVRRQFHLILNTGRWWSSVLNMPVRWKRVFSPSWTISCLKKAICPCTRAVMSERVVMLPYSSASQEQARLRWALLGIVLWLGMINMCGVIREFSIWKVGAMQNVWTWVKRNNHKSTTQLSLAQFWRTSPSKNRLKISTSLIFTSLKIPEHAILLNSFPMLKSLPIPGMLKILFSSHAMLSRCFPLFQSWQLLKLCTISILGILPRSREPK